MSLLLPLAALLAVAAEPEAAQGAVRTPTVASVACQTAVTEKLTRENPGADDVSVDLDRVRERQTSPTEITVEGTGEATLDDSTGFEFSCTYDLKTATPTRVEYRLDGGGGFAAPDEDTGQGSGR